MQQAFATTLMTPTDPSIESLVRAVYELTALKRDIPRLAGFEHPVGLVPLGAVHQCAPARVKDVAEYLHVDLSVASRQVAALEAAGYVRREPDPDDRRSQRVSTTQAGDDALRRAHARIVDVFGSALETWSREDVEALTVALGRLRSDYERAVAGHPHRSSTVKEAA
jgi:DNA-binding MarR family transcriptional regulator